MDLDDDGNDDVISGSYWPGDMFVFRGLGDGEYAKGEKILAADGKALNSGAEWPSDDEPDMDSLASVPFADDYDDDGDYDLLVGNIAGRVIYIPNEGTLDSPAFNPENRVALESAGEPIRVPGGDSGPVVADWDGDDVPDLLVGAGDGSVWLYRNSGSREHREYEKGVALISAPSRSAGEVGPGTRVKIHVTDYNDDGRPDLLVGDFHSQQVPPGDLTPAQITERDALRRERDAISAEIQAYVEANGNTIEADDEEYAEISAKFGAVYAKLQPLEGGYEHHGYVWLYLQKGEVATRLPQQD